MKVCLINPPLLSTPGLATTEEIYQPLGLAYIAAVLKKDNHEVKILDAIVEDYTKKKINNKYLVGLTYKQIINWLKKEKPSVVGITIPFSAHAPSGLELARHIHAFDKKITVILGGPHPTIVPERCLSSSVDYVIMGEGEESFPELVNAIMRKKSTEEIKGIAYLKNNKVIKTPSRALIKNLDKLPFPARELLPLNKYFKAQKDLNYSRGANKRTATIITSRGCPFNCTFCSIAITMGQPFRGRSPKNVVDEIEHLIKDHNIESIEFEDDNFTFNVKRANEICDEIIKRNLKFTWRTPNGIRADLLTSKLLKKFKQIGCYELWFSPESGSQRVIDKVIGKHLPLKSVNFAVKECIKNGIKPNCFFVIGMVGETKQEINKTIEYMKKLKSLGAGCYINIATPLYGTRMYNLAKQNNYLRPITEDNLVYNNGLYIDTPEFTAEEVYELFLKGRKVQEQKNISLKLVHFIIKNPKKSMKYATNMIKEKIKINK